MCHRGGARRATGGDAQRDAALADRHVEVSGVLWQSFWWTDAPELTGIDDIPPVGGFLVTVPFALTLIAASWTRASPRGC